MRSMRGTNAPTVIKKLNPIIRGWAAYHRSGVSAETFGSLDQYLWELTYKWARFSHANKPTRWVVARYFGRFNKARQDRWVFGDRTSGAYLHKFAWTSIVRHPIVYGAASPDDPALADYWARRRRKTPQPINKTSRWLLKAQDGRCPICRDALLHDDHQPQTPREWETWLATTRKRSSNRHPGGRHAGPARTPSDTRRLPQPQSTGTSARLRTIKACLSRVLGNGHARCARDMTSSSGVRVPCGG